MFEVEDAPVELTKPSFKGGVRSPLAEAMEGLEPGQMIRVPRDKFGIEHVRNLARYIRKKSPKRYRVLSRGDEVLVVARA